MGHLGVEAFGKVLLVDAIGIRNLFPRPPLVPQKMTKEDLGHPATVLNAPNQRISRPPQPLLQVSNINLYISSSIFIIYPVHVTTRKSFGLMTRKLSVTESHRLAQFRGTFSRRKPSVASAN